MGIFWLLVLALLGLPAGVQRWLLSPVRRRGEQKVVADPRQALRAAAVQYGGAVYLGLTSRNELRWSRAERAVLVLGPPRSGKTSGVIIPTLSSHTGPAVSTSTKLDVWRATSRIRLGGGRVWVFDPTGSGARAGAQELRWSPVLPSRSWDGALLIARAMTTNIGAGTTDRSHWANRAQALLAPMLHAAAVHGRNMEQVVDWVMRHELDEPGILLEDQRCSRLAFGNLLGLLNTEERERSSIFSAAADALQAYGSEHALAAASDPNFDAARFVRSRGTVYIHAPAEAQAAAAPIVCALLAEIRRAAYHAHAAGQLTDPAPAVLALMRWTPIRHGHHRACRARLRAQQLLDPRAHEPPRPPQPARRDLPTTSQVVHGRDGEMEQLADLGGGHHLIPGQTPTRRTEHRALVDRWSHERHGEHHAPQPRTAQPHLQTSLKTSSDNYGQLRTTCSLRLRNPCTRDLSRPSV